jgi:CHAT domain-containing protein
MFASRLPLQFRRLLHSPLDRLAGSEARAIGIRRLAKFTGHGLILAACAAGLVGAQGARAQPIPAAAAANPLLTTAPTATGELVAGRGVDLHLEYQQLAAYTLNLPANTAATILLEQQDGAISATWLSPGEADGGAHDTRRNDNGRGAAIRFSLVSPQSASGKFEVRWLCITKTTACAVHASVESHAAADSDRQRAEAEEKIARGNALQRAKDKGDKAQQESRASALALYTEAFDQAKALGDLTLQRTALYWQARLALESQRYDQALAAAQQSTELPADDADPQGQAAAWKVLGYANAYRGNLETAIAAYRRAAELYAAHGDRLNNEILLENMARAHRAMGQNGKAIGELTEALAQARAIQDSHGIPASLEELGNLELARGELQPALDAYREAQDALAKWPDDTIHAHVLNGLGHVYTLLGEPDQAQDAFSQSLTLWRKLKDSMGEAYALDGQAFLAFTNRDYPQARQRFRATLDLVQSLHLDRESAIILEELGEAEQASGDLNEANDAFQQSLALARKLHLAATEADCLRSLGEAAAARGDTVSASANYEQAGKLYESVGGGSHQALLEADESQLERSEGHLAEAEQRMQRALAIIESSRTSIRNSDYRSAYFSTQRSYYDQDISLLMELERRSAGKGYAARAFEVSERARARALLDSLHEQGIQIHETDAALAARQSELADEIEAQSFALTQAEETASGDAEAIRAKLHLLQAQQADFDRLLRSRDPAYASLAQGETVSLEALQQKLLDPQSVLLEYWLGTEHSYLWAITKRKLVSFTLPGSASLEAQSRRLYANLVARNLAVDGETLESRAQRIDRADALATQQAAELAAVILAPATAILATHSNVVVVSEGSLTSVPFAALPLAGRRLVETHQVAYLASASVLPQLRANRPPVRPLRIALIADPVFSSLDPRVAHGDKGAVAAGTPPTGDSADLTRSASDTGLRDFPRLVYSRQEAESIASLIPASQQWSAMDFDASLEAVRNLDWSRFTIAHFSTHALLDTIHPDLSGIVLSLVDAQGHPRDGFIRVRDIYNMHVPADLVVLSACRTALGKEIRGEGVVGLARAFSYAGSQRVLATLWDVNDRATASLMSDLYRRLLRSRLSPADALAQAQRELAQSANWRAPYFWASFVLQGDWQPSANLSAGGEGQR